MKTRYSARVWQGFETLFRPWMRRRLDGVHVRGLVRAAWIPRKLPVLLVANHTSWWDGFLLREVHRTLRPDAPLYVVMAEKELRRVPVFRWMGAVPLPESRFGARTLLRDLEDRLERHPDAVLAIFPQGRIWPTHAPIRFRQGAAWLASRLGPLTAVPVGLHLETLTRPGPAAFVSVGGGRVIQSMIATEELEEMVRLEVQTIRAFTRRHGEDAIDHWDDREDA